MTKNHDFEKFLEGFFRNFGLFRDILFLWHFFEPSRCDPGLIWECLILGVSGQITSKMGYPVKKVSKRVIFDTFDMVWKVSFLTQVSIRKSPRRGGPFWSKSGFWPLPDPQKWPKWSKMAFLTLLTFWCSEVVTSMFKSWSKWPSAEMSQKWPKWTNLATRVTPDSFR